MVDDCNDDFALAADLFCDEEMDLESLENSVKQILKAIGEDPQREGLIRTPQRVAKSYQELLSGYRMDPRALINEAVFDVAYDEMVVVRDIEFASMCEHHMLPFMGRVHVAYIPSDKVIGLSKIPRIVDLFSKRLQVQERMTTQIADYIDFVLNPKGVAVVAEGLHMCMMLRGVKKQEARMTTSAMRGVFRTDMSTRMEFLDNISRGASELHI
jgi:GTP cyclohydrolase I